MNQITKKNGTVVSHQVAFWSRVSRGALTMLAMASLMFTSNSARAACGKLSGLGSGSGIKLPILAQAAGDEESASSGRDSIVGLWHVVYTAGGSVFNETLDQWHSDGTEFENAYLAPAQGNICFGVWKPTGPNAVRLHHIGWTFDPTSTGTANGTFTLDENNTLSRDGKSYTGTFTFKTFDLKGTQGAEVTGTIAATRITVD
ncbi:MAG TPA: hypothetical protein VFE27_20455 [Acidobacteriaceae bacterium]|jgi:hypothetical protein|nr:hypothetical protein [Acidobacteriaceae bacterium]